MKKGLGLAVVAAIGMSVVGHAAAQSKWPAHVDIEAKPGTKRTLGEADLFLPVTQDARTLWFANVRARLDDRGSQEGNVGFGGRRMLDGGWNVGAHAFFDRRRSETGNLYNQLAFGGEALGRDWDVRANVYRPIGTRVRTIDSTDTAAVTANTLQVSTVVREERALRGFDAEVGWRVPLTTVEDPRQLRLFAGGYQFKDDVAKVSGPRVRAEMTVAQWPVS